MWGSKRTYIRIRQHIIKPRPSISERELRNTGMGLLGTAGVAQGKGLDSSWHGSKREGGPELLVHRERVGKAHQPASHSPSWLLRSIHRAVGEELGGLIWGGRVQAFCLLIHFEEHLLLSLLLVQIFFQSLGQREGRKSSVRSHRTQVSQTQDPHQSGLLWKFHPPPGL